MTPPPATQAARRRAILCIIGSSALFTGASALIKALGAGISPIEVAFFRSLVASVIVTALMAHRGHWAYFRTHRPWGHAGRTLFGFYSMLAAYYGYSHLPLAFATAIGFAMPLVLCLLSFPLLGERVGPSRLAASVVGLGGVLVMLRPWDVGAVPTVPVLIVLSGVVGWAMAMISIRKLGGLGENNNTIMLWFSIGCTVLSGVGVLPFWTTPDLWQLAGLIGVGLVSTVAQVLMTQGYRSAESALLAPFEYGAIIYAALYGLAFWGEVPDGWSLAGVAILISAGAAIWRNAGA